MSECVNENTQAVRQKETTMPSWLLSKTGNKGSRVSLTCGTRGQRLFCCSFQVKITENICRLLLPKGATHGHYSDMSEKQNRCSAGGAREFFKRPITAADEGLTENTETHLTHSKCEELSNKRASPISKSVNNKHTSACFCVDVFTSVVDIQTRGQSQRACIE